MRVAALGLLAALLALPAAAAEMILDYHSEIRVLADASLVVEETIRVNAEGESIKRGIYRDFPTIYPTPLGGRTRVEFAVVEATRDGSPEPWHTESLDNGVRVYLGQKDVLLRPGEYTYTITYRTSRQLGFFDTHDELYWNVTGNDWAFPILRVSARVRLPKPVSGSDLRLEAYTGWQGDKGQDYAVSLRDGDPWIETTVPLQVHQGLTIVVGFPKGVVAEPSAEQRRQWLLQDNQPLIIALTGLVVLLAYYLLVWRLFGKDPRGGVIIPLFEPPKGVSPAAARYLARMGFDHKTFACAVIDMAVRGYLRIEEEGGDYLLALADRNREPQLPPEERRLAGALSLNLTTPFELKQSNRHLLTAALKNLESDLKKAYHKSHFVTNSLYTIPGLLVSVAVQAATAIGQGGEQGAASLFIILWLTFWTFGVVMLLKQVVFAWRSTRGKPVNAFGAVFITLFAIPFVVGEFFGLGMLLMLGSWLSVATLVALVGLNWGFYEWLKAPTLVGRRVYDELEGFRIYLSVAEGNRLQLLHPPELTPGLFEKYLPYALALDVENEWAEAFAELFRMRERAGEAPSPSWYRGSHWNSGSLGGFGSALGGSLSGAIASSSAAPGSSSGGGGGGSSGGGGGGGGGGGW